MPSSRPTTAEFLETWYHRYNRPEFIEPDPLQIVREFAGPRDQEIAGLIASSLALGRVASILAAVRGVLHRFQSLRIDIVNLSDAEILDRCEGFVYRFYKARDLFGLILGIRNCLLEYGSLNGCFLAGEDPDAETIEPALTNFVAALSAGRGPLRMLADPRRGSCCKRLHLFLRWMVRSDRVDPGTWRGVDRRRLLVPLDTHMHRTATLLGLTERRNADARAAAEITDAFRRIRPDDPVRYDFCLTRIGIHPQLGYGDEAADPETFRGALLASAAATPGQPR